MYLVAAYVPSVPRAARPLPRGALGRARWRVVNDGGAREPRGGATPKGVSKGTSVDVGARLFDRLRIDSLLERGDGWSLFLGDDEVRSELVLVVVAASPSLLAGRLADLGPAARTSRHAGASIAEIALTEEHLARFGEKLLARGRELDTAVRAARRPAEQRLDVGDVFAGRYRIEALLGRGGMGEVYRARDDVLRREVALKVVQLDGGDDAQREAKSRLLSEARFVATMKHPHIVEIFDAGEADGLPYLVLEMCDGGNMRRVIEEDVATFGERLAWLSQIAEALAYAHARGIVHRDIKPENVLLTRAGIAKLADFGIAKAFSNAPSPGATTGIVGTPRYMAPEQLFGGPVDGRADQFSWALLAQELISGVHPRGDGGSSGAGPSRQTRRVSPRVRRAIARAASSDPRARFASMDDVVEALGNEGRRRRGGRVLVAPAIAVACVAGAVALTARGRWTSPARGEATSAAPTISASAAQPGSPATTSPDAIAAYEAGEQLWYDGATGAARERFAFAAEKDPRFARAHVLYVAASEWLDGPAREHFARARSLRALLDGRDVALLDALQPLVDEPPNVGEATRRLDLLVRARPKDVIVRLVAAQNALRARRPGDVFARVSAADGAIAHWLLARAHLQLDDVATARAELGACVAASPAAVDCLDWTARLEANEGRCDEAEQASRKLVAADPSSPDGYAYLARAVLKRTGSTEAARAILEQRWTLVEPDRRDEVRYRDEFFLRTFDGAFDAALDAEAKWERAIPSGADAAQRGFPLVCRLDVEREIGADDAAAATAREIATKSAAWVPSEYFDVPIEAARALYVTGQLPRDRFLAQRAAAVEDMKRRGGYFAAEGVRWFEAYVQTVKTREDALDAVAQRPTERPVVDAVFRDVGVEAELGRTFALAGDLVAATQSLTRATRACAVYKSASQVRAYLDLGGVLARAGDRAGACDAYARIVDRWGRDARSVTAKRARAAWSSLGCTSESKPF